MSYSIILTSESLLHAWCLSHEDSSVPINNHERFHTIAPLSCNPYASRIVKESSNHNSPLQSILSTLEGITTHNSLSFFTISRYLMRCSSLHSFNCGKRDSIPFTSNPFLTLAINTISFVFRLRALYSSNHSLCFSHSVCFIPFILLLQQLIIINHNQIAHYGFTGECILILQHMTPFCQQTSHL